MHSPAALAFRSPHASSLQVSLHNYHQSDSPQVDSVAYSNSPVIIALPPPPNSNLENLIIQEVIHHHTGSTNSGNSTSLSLPLPIVSPQVSAATLSALLASPNPFASAAQASSSAAALLSQSNASMSANVADKRSRGDDSMSNTPDEAHNKRMRLEDHVATRVQPPQIPRATPSPSASPLLTHSPLTFSKPAPFTSSSSAANAHHSHRNSLQLSDGSTSSSMSMHIGMSLMHYAHAEVEHDHRDRRKEQHGHGHADFSEHDHHHLLSSPLTLPTSNSNLTATHGISLNGVSGSPLVGAQPLPLLSPGLQSTNSPALMSLTTGAMGSHASLSHVLSMSTPSVTSAVSNSPTQHPTLPPSFLAHPGSSSALGDSYAPMSPNSHSVKDDDTMDADEHESGNTTARSQEQETDHDNENENETEEENQKDNENDEHDGDAEGGDAGDDEETEGGEEDDDEAEAPNGKRSVKNGHASHADEDTDSEDDDYSDGETLASAAKKKAKGGYGGKDEKRASSASNAFDSLRPFGCEFCKKLYVSEKKLRRHLDTSHPKSASSDRGVLCVYPDCERRFKVPGKLKKHLQLHLQTKAYRCPEENCNKEFVYAENLSAHLRIHAGKLPWLCPEDGCGAEFKNPADLKKHKRKHKAGQLSTINEDRMPMTSRTPPPKRSNSRSRDGTPARSRTPKADAMADSTPLASITSFAASNPLSASKAKKRKSEKTPPSHPAFARSSTVPPSSSGTSLLHSHPPTAATNFSLPFTGMGMMLGSNQRSSEQKTPATLTQPPYQMPYANMMQTMQNNFLATPATRPTASQYTVYAHQVYSYCHGFMLQAQTALKNAEDAVKQKAAGTPEHGKAQTECQEAQQRYKYAHELASSWYQQYQQAAAQAGINSHTATTNTNNAQLSAGNVANAATNSVGTANANGNGNSSVIGSPVPALEPLSVS